MRSFHGFEFLLFGRLFCGRVFQGSDDLPSRGGSGLPFQTRTAFRAIGRGAGHHRAALGTELMPGLVKIKQRFLGKGGAASDAFHFVCICSRAAFRTNLGLLHDLRAEAKLLHNCRPVSANRHCSVSHQPHHLHKGVWLQHPYRA